MRSGSHVKDPAPPRPRDGGGGGGWRWVVTARGVVEAELIKGVLEGSGVSPVVLDAHDPSPGAWMFPAGNVNALVRILVPTPMLEAARIALLEVGLASDEQVPPADARTPSISRAIGMALTAIVLLAVLVYQLRSALQ